MKGPFASPASFVALGRLTSLVLSPDGLRLVAVRQEPDAKGADFKGEPDQLPHRFLQFTNENHWIDSPGNAQTWYDTVLDFVDRHLDAAG